MNSTYKKVLFLSLPFLVSIILFLLDIAYFINSFFLLIFYSIFTFGIPFFIVCSIYALAFKGIKDILKISKTTTSIAFILTIIALVLFIFGASKSYKPIEKRIYFTTQTTEKLKQRSLELFKKEYGIEGKIKNYHTTSRLNQYQEIVDVSTQDRTYDIAVIPKDPNSDEVDYILGGAEHYVFINKFFGIWKLKD